MRRGMLTAILVGFVAGLAPGCGQPQAPKAAGGGAGGIAKPGEAPVPGMKDDGQDVANLPDVLQSQGEVHGPHITVWVDGNLYIDTVLRDNEAVSAELLRNYLSRMVFQNTKKVRIKAADADPNTATLTAKFEIRLADSRRKEDTIAKVAFNELRLARSPSETGTWLLTAEGLDLIDQTISKK